MLYVLRLVVRLGDVERDDQDTPYTHNCVRHHDLEDWKISASGT